MREIKHVIERQEQVEYSGPADHAETAIDAERVPGLLERSARRIPQQHARLAVLSLSGFYAPGDPDAMPLAGIRLALMRMAPVNGHVAAIHAVAKEFLVGLELDAVRHVTLRVGQHAVFRDNGVAFDPGGPSHYSPSLRAVPSILAM